MVEGWHTTNIKIKHWLIRKLFSSDGLPVTAGVVNFKYSSTVHAACKFPPIHNIWYIPIYDELQVQIFDGFSIKSKLCPNSNTNPMKYNLNKN